MVKLTLSLAQFFPFPLKNIPHEDIVDPIIVRSHFTIDFHFIVLSDSNEETTICLLEHSRFLPTTAYQFKILVTALLMIRLGTKVVLRSVCF